MTRRITGNTKLVQVKITPKDFAVLEHLARTHETTVSDIVRRQIKALIAAQASLISVA